MIKQLTEKRNEKKKKKEISHEKYDRQFKLLKQ